MQSILPRSTHYVMKLLYTFTKKQIALFQTANTPDLFRQKIMKFMKEDWITSTPTSYSALKVKSAPN